MNTDNPRLPVFYLKPGELHIADQPGIVTTVLGSCVSVTMFHQKRGVGAICHGLMPEWTGAHRYGKSADEGFKYVDYSIGYMLERFRAFGIAPAEVEVKLFGGADMFPTGEGDQKYVSMGKRNVLAALATLKRTGIGVSARDVGGIQGRKLHFYIHTGEVFLKKLKLSDTFRVIKIQSEASRTAGGLLYVARR